MVFKKKILIILNYNKIKIKMVYDFITKYYFIKLKYNNKTLHFNKHNIKHI